jgi:hypothetical protein
MAPDHLTVLTTAGRKLLATKRISSIDGEWSIEEYGNAKWWSARQVPVRDLVSLGQALADLGRDPHSCVIRGEPIEAVDLTRCRRLKDPDPEDGTLPSFAPAARRWLGIDVDSLPTPVWDPEKLARRRAAIERDRAEQGPPRPKGEDDGEDVDLAGDEDPAPIDPARDWAISIRAAVITLPLEFHDISAYWQMTSGAGIKPGVRLRLFYWLDRPVSDDEAKRWFEASPVDCSIYSAVQPHYTAAPIFDPPELDPVPLRSGFWWRHRNTVTVPNLEPKPEPKPQSTATYNTKFDRSDRAQRYAAVCIDSVVAAPTGTGDGRRRLLAAARALYGMANAGLLNQGQVTAELKATMENRGWTAPGRSFSPDEVERHLAWARAHADTVLPEGFR